MIVSDDSQLYHTRKCVGDEKPAFKFSHLGASEQPALKPQNLCVHQLQQLRQPKVPESLSPFIQMARSLAGIG